MPANTNVTDGPLKLNEQTVSLLNNAASPVATTYILKKGSLKSGVDKVKSLDQNGAFRSRALALQDTEGSMTLQFVLNADKPPQPLQFFTVVDSAGVTRNLILEGVGENFGTREEVILECEICLMVGTKVAATYPSLTQ